MFCASLYEDCIIKGDLNCDLFSLLFQTALYHVTRGHRVIFICDQDVMNKRLPKLNTNFNISRNERILKGVNIKYCSSLLDLSSFFANFHLFEEKEYPHVVIIHDIIRYLELSLFCEIEENHHNNNDNDDDEDLDLDLLGSSTDSSSSEENEDKTDEDEEKEKEKETNNDSDKDSSQDEDEDFLNEDGELEYGIKLAQFLPILKSTKNMVGKCFKKECDGSSNKKKIHNSGLKMRFLKELTVMIGMECLENECEELYPFWRMYGFERFLKCSFNARHSVIRIQYDTETDNDNNDNDDNDNHNKKLPPSVYCHVTNRNIDMIKLIKKK